MVVMGWGQDRMGRWGWDGGMRTRRWGGEQRKGMVGMGMVVTGWDGGHGIMGVVGTGWWDEDREAGWDGGMGTAGWGDWNGDSGDGMRTMGWDGDTGWDGGSGDGMVGWGLAGGDGREGISGDRMGLAGMGTAGWGPWGGGTEVWGW